jgi:hypothetical protein
MPGMISRCWVWLGVSSLNDIYGRLNIKVGDRWLLKTPYNCAWVLAGGQLPPPGFNLHHLCKNTQCVNPHHLAMVTATGHRRFHIIVLSATCPNGHPFNEVNPLVDGNGYRRCRECANESRQRYNERRGQKHAA